MRSGFALVSADAVRRILHANQKRTIDLVARAYRLHAGGDTVNPPSLFLRFPSRPDSRIIALPAAVGGDIGVAGMKWISSFPGNVARGLPRASAVLVLNDPDTGFPIACLESSLISAARTAASAALAATVLSTGRPARPRVGFVGTGLIARHVADYLMAAGVSAAELSVTDRDPARAARFADDVGRRLLGRPGLVHADPGQTIRASDVVVFATTAGVPHVTDPDWFAHHPLVLHLSLRDLAPGIILDSVNVVDDVDHCLTAGTSVHLAEQSCGHRGFVSAILADVLSGRYTPPADRTVVFSPFGLGVLDMALAEFVYTRAVADGTATVLPDFFAGLDPDGLSSTSDLDAPPIAADQIAAAACNALRGTDLPIDSGRTVVGALVRHARATPDRVAVVHQDVELSYGDLACRVARVRRALLADGCVAGETVACVGARDVDTIAVFLALESIGAVYLPMDPAWPAARQAAILRSGEAARVVDLLPVTAPERTVLRAAAQDAAIGVLSQLAWSAPWPGDTVTALSEIDRADCGDGTEPRYLIFTSGTTGVPKGAVVEHGGMVNHLLAKIDHLGLDDADRVGFTAPTVFDISVCQMLMPIVTGGAIVVVDDAQVRIPRRLCLELARRAVTVVELVPVIAAWIADEVARNAEAAPKHLRWLVCTGEELRPPVAERILAALPDLRLLNAYGFTETSDDVAHYEVQPGDTTRTRLPVGTPVPNTALYVLVEQDGSWRAAEPGEPGELFVGGLPVCRGYAGDERQTRAAYFRDVLDPGSPTGRLYRTGDAAVIDDGLLYCLGRLDRQTKISGVRIELAEVEVTLQRHPAVAQCAALVRGKDSTAQLVAYYVPADPVDEATLRAYLVDLLPPAMVPDVWVELDALPLSTNGKTDYRALEGLA